MFAVSIARMDKQGRIRISPLFDEIPSSVAILYTIGDAKIQIVDAKKSPEGFPSSCVRTIDPTARMTIPRWLRDQFKTSEWFLGIDEKGNKFLFPKKD